MEGRTEGAKAAGWVWNVEGKFGQEEIDNKKIAAKKIGR